MFLISFVRVVVCSSIWSVALWFVVASTFGGLRFSSLRFRSCSCLLV